MTKLGARLRERALPLGEGEELRDWAYSILCQALLQAGLELEQGFDPDPPHYPVGVLMTYNAPAWALPWAAQIVGIGYLPAGLGEQDLRDLIKGAANWQSGTTATMEAVAKRYLTGTKTVYFRERDGDPYFLEVVTKASETPDPEAVRRALEAAKPVGLVLHYRTVPGLDYQQLTTDSLTNHELYRDLHLHYASYRALSDGTRT